MMEKYNIPTLDEFKSRIEKNFMDHWGKKVTKQEMMKFLYADSYIENMYKRNMNKYKDGKITERMFAEGIPATIAYEYIMEYDW